MLSHTKVRCDCRYPRHPIFGRIPAPKPCRRSTTLDTSYIYSNILFKESDRLGKSIGKQTLEKSVKKRGAIVEQLHVYFEGQ
jgi:hypothetical protein